MRSSLREVVWESVTKEPQMTRQRLYETWEGNPREGVAGVQTGTSVALLRVRAKANWKPSGGGRCRWERAWWGRVVVGIGCCGKLWEGRSSRVTSDLSSGQSLSDDSLRKEPDGDKMVVGKPSDDMQELNSGH